MNTITTQDLINLKACEPELNVFIYIFGNEVEITIDNIKKAIQKDLPVAWLITRYKLYNEYKEKHDIIWKEYKEKVDEKWPWQIPNFYNEEYKTILNEYIDKQSKLLFNLLINYNPNKEQ